MPVKLTLSDALAAELYAQLGAQIAPPPVPAAWTYRAPAPVQRRNSLWLSPSGSDSNPGTADRPRRSLMQSILARAVPNDCAVFYVGDHDIDDRNGIAGNWGGGVVFPTDLALRPAGASGTSTLRGRRAGNAFTLLDAGSLRWQVCGLGITGFADTSGNGTVTIDGDTADVDIDGCTFHDNGSGNTSQDHGIYLGGGASFGVAPRRIRVRGNVVDERGNNGFWIHAYKQARAMAHDVVVEGNSVAWTGCGAGLFTANFVAPANWTVQRNDLRVYGAAAVNGEGKVMPSSVIDFYDADVPPPGAGGVDRSFVLNENVLALLMARDDSAYPGMPCVAVRVRKVSPAHQPVRTANRLFVPPGHNPDAGERFGTDTMITDLPPRLAVLSY